MLNAEELYFSLNKAIEDILYEAGQRLVVLSFIGFEGSFGMSIDLPEGKDKWKNLTEEILSISKEEFEVAIEKLQQNTHFSICLNKSSSNDDIYLLTAIC